MLACRNFLQGIKFGEHRGRVAFLLVIPLLLFASHDPPPLNDSGAVEYCECNAGGKMTRADCELIANVLQRRVVDIREMFRPPDAHVTDVERFAKVQVLTLAHDIGIAFAKQDPTFDELLGGNGARRSESRQIEIQHPSLA